MNTRTLLTLGLCAAAALLVGATATVPPWGLSLQYVDAAVAPGADFFGHSNGGWLKAASIPPDRQVAGVNLELDQGNEAKLKAIVADLLAAQDDKLTADGRKLRDLYAAFMDTKAIEAAGLGPVQP